MAGRTCAARVPVVSFTTSGLRSRASGVPIELANHSASTPLCMKSEHAPHKEARLTACVVSCSI